MMVIWLMSRLLGRTSTVVPGRRWCQPGRRSPSPGRVRGHARSASHESPAPGGEAPLAVRGGRRRGEQDHPAGRGRATARSTASARSCGQLDGRCRSRSARPGGQGVGQPLGVGRQQDDPRRPVGGRANASTSPAVSTPRSAPPRMTVSSRPGKALEGRHRGERVGGQGIVDEGQPAALPDGPAPRRQPFESVHRRPRRPDRRAPADEQQRPGDGAAQVPDVVPARAPAGPGEAPSGSPSTTTAPDGVDPHPAGGPEQGPVGVRLRSGAPPRRSPALTARAPGGPASMRRSLSR